MEKIIKLKNGNIVFVSRQTRLDPLHGISFSCPKLKQVNFRFSAIKTTAYVDVDTAMAMLKKSIDVKNVYSPRPETMLQKRLKIIVDALVQRGMEPLHARWPKGKLYAFYSYSQKAILVARPLKVLDDEIFFQWNQDGKICQGQHAKNTILAIEDEGGSVEIAGRKEKFTLLKKERFEQCQKLVEQSTESTA